MSSPLPITMRQVRALTLAGQAAGQFFGVVLAMLDIPVPGETKPMRALHVNNPTAQSLVMTGLLPNAIAFCGVVGLCGVLFREFDSKALFLASIYYHVVNVLELAPSSFGGRKSFVLENPVQPMLFHAFFAVMMIGCLISIWLEDGGDVRRRQKKQ